MELTITDVTEMRGGMFCVAGWNAAEKRMIRPLPNGANWPLHLLQQHGVLPGATLSVESSGGVPNGAFPHLTEDTLIDASRIRLLTAAPAAWFGEDAPPRAPNLPVAFQGKLERNSVWNSCVQGLHVPLDTRCRSLWGVACARRCLNFIEEDFKGTIKLRAQLFDGTALYKLPVSSKVLNEAWRGGGLASVKSALPNEGRLHIRVGLARAFDAQPKKCFVMVNGVYW